MNEQPYLNHWTYEQATSFAQQMIDQDLIADADHKLRACASEISAWAVMAMQRNMQHFGEHMETLGSAIMLSAVYLNQPLQADAFNKIVKGFCTAAYILDRLSDDELAATWGLYQGWKAGTVEPPALDLH